MSSENKVKGITTFDELLDEKYGEVGSIEREKFHSKSEGWSQGYKDGYLQALQDWENGVVNADNFYQTIEKLEGDE